MYQYIDTNIFMELGASFSHIHLKSLNIDPLNAIKEYKSLGFKWVRLGCYWNEIEKERGIFDFSNLDYLVNYCNKKKINTILTVGMKAPRWPEYYIPEWILKYIKLEKNQKIDLQNKMLFDATLNFIKETVNHYKKISSIKLWQIENEPLNPSGPLNLSVDFKFLEKEVLLVKKSDKRKVLNNLWGNVLFNGTQAINTLKIADIVGFDIYPKQYSEYKGNYIGSFGGMFPLKIFSSIIRATRPLFITELQAEPWEPENAYQLENPPSFLPADFGKNLNYVLKLKPEVVLFWGFEYWLYRKMQGDNRYWNAITNLLKSSPFV